MKFNRTSINFDTRHDTFSNQHIRERNAVVSEVLDFCQTDTASGHGVTPQGNHEAVKDRILKPFLRRTATLSPVIVGQNVIHRHRNPFLYFLVHFLLLLVVQKPIYIVRCYTCSVKKRSGCLWKNIMAKKVTLFLPMSPDWKLVSHLLT